MKKYSLVFLLVYLILLTSCSIIKTVSLLKEGSIDTENFAETINFEDRAGLIIIKVLIKEKSYDFIFDTGAPCAISSELAQELGLEADFEVNSIDSEGNKSKAGFVEINNFKIGSLSFNNIGTAIIDFKQIQEIECIKADGIIGANLMNKVKWQINYQDNTITLTDDINNLNISDSSLIIDFNSSISGTPLININLPGNTTAKKILFDTGFTGDIILSSKVFEKLVAKNNNLVVFKGYGVSSISVYGAKSNTSYFVKLDSLKLGQLNLSDIIVEFKGNNDGIIGNKVFRNFKVTLDWDNNKIYMEPVKQAELNKLMTFGFKPVMKDNKLLVGFIYENSPADSVLIKLNDKIISINEIDYSNISITDYCEILLNKVEWEESEHILIKWENANGIQQSAKLSKKDLANDKF